MVARPRQVQAKSRLPSPPPAADIAGFRQPTPQLQDFLKPLGLPLDFVRRGTRRTADVARLEKAFERWFPQRKFFLGLMVASIAVVENLLEQVETDRMPDALEKYPPRELSSSGTPVKTLTIVGPRRSISLRGYVNRMETVTLGTLKRFDYPSAAPHTTWAWTQHRGEIELLFSMTPEERSEFGAYLWQRILELPTPAEIQRAPRARPFAVLLRNFDTTAYKDERSGAHLQGMVYAYMRADSPSVTVVASRVRAGSNRFGGVGDVDGWYGADLALTAEVRDLVIDEIGGLSGFIRNVAMHKDPTAMVVAREFSDEVQEGLANENILTLTRDKLAENVDVWDMRKQYEAMRHFEHYVLVIERNQAIARRYEQFLKDEKLELG